jgi:hypothetical protein
MGQDVFDHCVTHSLASGFLFRMHRLQLGVKFIQPLERSDPDQDPVSAGAEEGDVRVQELLDAEGEGVLSRGDRSRERQVRVQ